jgi:CRP-like cAMP-binding protein
MQKPSDLITSPHGFLSRLTPSTRALLVTAGASRRYKAGSTLLREGERSQHVVALVQGRVKITSTAPNGYEAVLGIRGPGDLVGEMAVLGNLPRSAAVVALDPVRTLIIAGQDFKRIMSQEQGAGVKLAELIADRLRAANRWRLEFGAYPVRKRLALVLQDLDRWYGVLRDDGTGSTDIDLALSQGDLAGLIGASVEAVAKATRQLSRQRIISTSRRHVAIENHEALAEIADQA